MGRDLEMLWRRHFAPCSRCDAMVFRPWTLFRHDVRCWGWRTALHNARMLVLVALGVTEFATEGWDDAPRVEIT